MVVRPLALRRERIARPARVRMRALLSLLEDKGILLAGEFDERAQTTWESDYEALSQELWEAMTAAGDEPAKEDDEP